MEKQSYLGTLLSGLGGAAVGGTAGALGSENALMGGILGSLAGAGAGVGARHGGAKALKYFGRGGQQVTSEVAPKALQKAEVAVSPGIFGRGKLGGGISIPGGEFKRGLPVGSQPNVRALTKEVEHSAESARIGDNISKAIQDVKNRGARSLQEKASLPLEVKKLRSAGHLSEVEARNMLSEIDRIKLQPAGTMKTTGLAPGSPRGSVFTGQVQSGPAESQFKRLVRGHSSYKNFLNAVRSGDEVAVSKAQTELSRRFGKSNPDLWNKLFSNKILDAELSVRLGNPKLWKGASDMSIMQGIFSSLTKNARGGSNEIVSTTFPSNWGDYGAATQQAMAPLMESPAGKDFDILQGGPGQAPSSNTGITSDLTELGDITEDK